MPKCELCLYSVACHKGCFGAQYETSGELFQPAISVCNLQKQRFNFLIKIATINLVNNWKQI